jgi:hypothetical protein
MAFAWPKERGSTVQAEAGVRRPVVSKYFREDESEHAVTIMATATYTDEFLNHRINHQPED